MGYRRQIAMLLMLLSMLIVMLLWSAVQERRAKETVRVTDETYNYKADPINGLNIYTYGKDVDGKMIPFQGGPMWLIYEEHGCASCHGENGKGKKDVEDVDIPPPNIVRLVKNGGPVSYEKFSDIVRIGIKPNSTDMSMDMPRYSMPDNYLRDLYDYVRGF
ncbi:MAG: c-type cytochrome [Deltaproteobacteria bacterium]|nr:c-type cytochrome [Candidatus Zymogenaceae bacterium]